MQCIETVGGAAAEGATLAFGPSKACFSAIVMVIGAVQRASQSFEDLEALIEGMCGFLRTLETNLQSRASKETSRAIREICFEMMQEFLKVMQQLHIITASKREMFKFRTKNALLGDNLIRDGLDRMAKLNEAFMKTAVADILAKVNVGAMDVERMQKGMDTVLGRQRLHMIHEALNLSADNSDELNKQRHDGISSKSITGTGDWILSKEYFKSWTDLSTSTEYPVLCIAEVPQTGKSFLSNRIIRHLRSKSSHRSAEPILVAFYYFAEHHAGVLQRDDTGAHTRAIRNIIWQLANSDDEFAAYISQILGGTVDVHTTILWNAILDYAPRSRTTFFIVFDGLVDPPPDSREFIAKMMSDVSVKRSPDSLGSRIRLNLSGWHRFYELLGQFPYQLNHQSWIPFAEKRNRHNAADIELLVDNRLAKRGFPSDLCQRIKDTLVDCLPTTKLFHNLAVALAAIEKELSASAIDGLLERTREEARESSKREVGARLSRFGALGSSQVEELNYILAWVLAGGSDDPPSLALIKEVLHLRKGETLFGSLEARLRHDYFHLLNFAPRAEHVAFWGNIDVEGYLDDQIDMNNLEALSEGGSRVAPTRSRPSLAIEIERQRAALKFLCSPQVYARIGLDEFFDSKLGSQMSRRHSHRGRVQLDRDKSHFEVVQTCFRTMCTATTTRVSEELETIITRRLPKHLEMFDLRRIAKESKQEVVQQMLRVFYDEQVVKAWWTSERTNNTRLRALCTAVARWLCDLEIADVMKDVEYPEVGIFGPATQVDVAERLFGMVQKHLVSN